MGTLATRLFRLRQIGELTARQLDLLAGLTVGHTRFIETEKKLHPSADTIHRLSVVLGCSVEYLLAGKGRAPTRAAISDAIKRAQSKRSPR